MDNKAIAHYCYACRYSILETLKPATPCFNHSQMADCNAWSWKEMKLSIGEQGKVSKTCHVDAYAVEADESRQRRTIKAFMEFPPSVRMILVCCLDADYQINTAVLYSEENRRVLKHHSLSQIRTAAKYLRNNCGGDIMKDGSGFAYGSIRLTAVKQSKKRAPDGTYKGEQAMEKYSVVETKEPALGDKMVASFIKLHEELEREVPGGDLEGAGDPDGDHPAGFFVVNEFKASSVVKMKPGLLAKLGDIAASMISCSLLDKDRELFHSFRGERRYPRNMFIACYKELQNVERHVDRLVAFGTVIISLTDSEEQLELWPGGVGDCACWEEPHQSVITSFLHKSGHAVAFLAGVPHMLAKPSKPRDQDRIIIVVCY